MLGTHLEERRNKILEFIIQTYVETAQPVGSHEVCRRFHLRVSPATVRNAMGDLEREALLSHPHTSAGRVPTNRGYRYYVDVLMHRQPLSEAEARGIEAIAHEPTDDLLELLQGAGKVAALLSGQASAVLAPRVTQGILRRIDLIPVDRHRILGVLMTTDGFLKHAFLDLQETIDTAEIARLSRFFNEELGGEPIGDIEERLQHAMMDATNAFNYLYKRAQELWSLGGFIESQETVFLDGILHLLMQPEFRDAHAHRGLLEILEQQAPIAAILRDTMVQGRGRVMIGPELDVPGLDRCSIVSAPYRVRSRPVGAIGIIGPTRIDYWRIVHLVDRLAETVGRALEQFSA